MSIKRVLTVGVTSFKLTKNTYGMKKVILFFTLLTFIMLLNSCAAMLVDNFSEGYARVPDPTRDKPPVRGIMAPGLPPTPVRFNSPEACARECNQLYGSAGGTMQAFNPAQGFCNCYTESLPIKGLGNVSNSSECSRMAGEAGYLRFFFDPTTGNCGGRGVYEEVGRAETKKDCYDMVKEARKSGAAWDSNTRKCVVDTRKIE